MFDLHILSLFMSHANPRMYMSHVTITAITCMLFIGIFFVLMYNYNTVEFTKSPISPWCNYSGLDPQYKLTQSKESSEVKMFKSLIGCLANCDDIT